LGDLFVLPHFQGELSELAAGEGGKLKRLSADQLEELRRTGEFSVSYIAIGIYE